MYLLHTDTLGFLISYNMVNNLTAVSITVKVSDNQQPMFYEWPVSTIVLIKRKQKCSFMRKGGTCLASLRKGDYDDIWFPIWVLGRQNSFFGRTK